MALNKSKTQPNKRPKNKSQKEISIAVLTSGGDAQGMNAAIRAVVRYAIHKKSKGGIKFKA